MKYGWYVCTPFSRTVHVCEICTCEHYYVWDDNQKLSTIKKAVKHGFEFSKAIKKIKNSEVSILAFFCYISYIKVMKNWLMFMIFLLARILQSWEWNMEVTYVYLCIWVYMWKLLEIKYIS